MSRLIDADALKDRLQALAYDDWNQGANTSWADAYLEVAEMVDEQPTADVVPVRKGKWVRNDNGTYFCSLCNSWIPEEQHYYARYCLHCGASMTEGAEE